ncbi:MAG: biopolymer transporter ExbD [Acidobacteria bacterium]|nr:biopolymer transporter ExbD [Acidobacteriota bacterium]
MFKIQTLQVTSEINVVPMADIMLVLLIIFMVVTPMLQKGVSVDLARTQNPRQMPDADKEDAIVLAVTRSGNIFLVNQQIAIEEITAQVKERLQARLDKTVYVKSDARARYGDVVKVVDEVRAAGVDQLGLLTEKVETKRPGPGMPVVGETEGTTP